MTAHNLDQEASADRQTVPVSTAANLTQDPRQILEMLLALRGFGWEAEEAETAVLSGRYETPRWLIEENIDWADCKGGSARAARAHVGYALHLLQPDFDAQALYLLRLIPAFLVCHSAEDHHSSACAQRRLSRILEMPVSEPPGHTF